MKLASNSQLFHPAWVVACVVLLTLSAGAQYQQPREQSSGNSVSASLAELQSQVRELKDLVLQLQHQTTANRAEIMHLRDELKTQRDQPGGGALSADLQDEQSFAHVSSTSPGLEQRLDQLQEDQQLLAARVNEQYQTKLESASKYRVRFSGMVLFNLFGNSGSVDNIDVPTWVLDSAPGASSGSVGGTLRQSILGFEVFGPEVFHARSSGNVSFDFGGGFPGIYNGVDAGIARLRTAAVRLDWKNTSLIAGQDQLFISPLSPTSFASIIVPPLAAAGNLWAWTPQLRVEQRFDLAPGLLTVQGGIMDPLTGQPPNPTYSSTSFRAPGAGEQSRVPAFAARVAYSHPLFGQTFSIGTSGYYTRQNWGFNRHVDGYAAIADFNLPLDRRFALSGSFYRGQAIGGLDAALGRSVLYNGLLGNPATIVLPVNTVGGWSQLKFTPMPKLEFNAAAGLDNPFASDIRAFGEQSLSYGATSVTRNREAFANVIYRPRSDLLFSLQYLRLRTYSIYDYNNEAGQLNLSMGILF